MFFSIVIPLYNRPQEIKELLQSLVKQSYKRFEVIVVEDGSNVKEEELVQSFADRLNIRYFYKNNEGQGFARNVGFEQAMGDFFIVFDSDVIVPTNYLEQVLTGLINDQLDAFGGPDAAHSSFTTTQKAISYSMTSPFTTGGIRGNKKHIGSFHPRSFNMGISREVWEKTGGFKLARRSEDIEFSIRMIDSGFKVGLIPTAFVYHKRRTNFSQFFNQIFSFGKGRIDIYKLYPKELKIVHTIPFLFVAGIAVTLMLSVFKMLTGVTNSFFYFVLTVGYSFLGVYTFFLFVHALMASRSIVVALKSIVAAYTQLIAYGCGFITQYVDKVLMVNNPLKK